MATATTAKNTKLEKKDAQSAPSSTAQTTTNVWQQRMAARAALQQTQPRDTVSTAPVTATIVAEPSRVPSPRVPEEVPEPRQPTPVASPHTSLAPSTPEQRDPLNIEEELKKAPGYRVLPMAELSTERVVQFDEKPLPRPIGQGFARAPGTKINVDESTKPGKELGGLAFLEKSELADIWKRDGDSKGSSNEPAWGGQLLLGNGLSNMLGNLSLGPAEWASSIAAGADFASSLPASKPSAPATSSTFDWIGAPVPQQNNLYSRPTQPTRPVPVQSSSMSGNREAFLQQLAAQLSGHSTSTSNQQQNSYYASNSYSETAMSQQTKSYMQAFQSANQEYENLNNLLNSYNNSHYNVSSNDYGQNFPNSSASTRPMQARPASYAPPPGFANVTPTPPNMNSSSMAPPPHLRQYYNGQNSQMSSQNTSAFNVYGQQQNNWSKLNTNSAPGTNWSSGGWN